MIILSRRDFLKQAARLSFAASGILRSSVAVAQNPVNKPAGATVIIARRPDVHVRPGQVSSGIIRTMLDQGITKLTGAADGTRAWLSIFNPGETIGIKVNAMGGRNICTHTEVAYAVAGSLVNAGFKPQQIIIWDRLTEELERGGYKKNRGNNDVLCFGTDNDYEPEPEAAGSIGSCFSTILSRQCDALISIPVLKDHDLSGVSLNLKNFYGAIHNPNKYHDNGCDPYIADLNAHPYIKNKLRLIICDGLTAQCSGGPGYKPLWAWPYSGLLFSRDPVAIDRTGCQIIEEQRKFKGLQTLAEAGRPPKHILSAAQRGLGVADIHTITRIMV